MTMKTRNALGPVAVQRMEAHSGSRFPLEKIIVVGDTPKDIACARALGARCLAVATGGHTLDALASHTPWQTVADFSDPHAIAQLLVQTHEITRPPRHAPLPSRRIFDAGHQNHRLRPHRIRRGARDAAESIVHMVAVMFASFSLSLADKPADHNHPYGHRKIAFFSAGLEGFLIVLAAAFILYQSVTRWIEGAAPSNLDQGLILTLLTVIINGALGFHLITQGRKAGALILVANGKHVLTDSWTSLGAVLGLALVH